MPILLFIVILLVLVLVHEFGHFAIAKWAKIRVDEFAFGFPPRIFGKRFGETTYSFNLLPLGGYVKIYGEDPNQIEEGADAGRSFVRQPRYVQAAVIVAGVIMNVVLAWALISLTLMIGIVTTLFTAVFVCKLVFDVYLRILENRGPRGSQTLSI
jgi:regulator of sigma E protease